MRATRILPAVLLAALATLAVTLPAGCERRRDEDESMLGTNRPDCSVAVVLDTSGSFAGRMDEAFPFFVAVTDRYFRDRVGMNDELIVAQISGAERSLLWRGPPRALRQKFPDAAAFRSFVTARSDPNGSRVHDAVADTIEELLSRPGVAEGKVPTALLVLSDLQDTGATPEESLRRLTDALKAYRRAKGVVGLYWVDQPVVGAWRARLRAAGYDPSNSVVETDITATPALPNFN
jgi:hypothetical protein